MAAKEIWIVGDSLQSHFAAPLDWLKECASCRVVPAVDSAPVAILGSGKSSDPDAVLLVQSWPGQILRRDVERLHAHLPLTRLVGLAGPWCEGEGRTGRPWPGVIRVPWRDWRWRLPRELGLGDAELSTAARLPRTATETDRLQQSIANLGRFSGCVELVTTSRTTADSWRGALQILGARAYCMTFDSLSDAPTIDLQWIDGWDSVSNVTAAGAEFPTVPRILSLHFPRPDDISRAARLGLAGILAQPVLLADLAAALDGLLSRAPRTARQPAA